MQAATGAPLNARRLQLTMAATLLAVVGADQITKQWALRALEPGVSRPVLGELLQLHLTFNPGAAFSLGTSLTWLFTALAAAVVVFLLWTSRRLGSVVWALALGCMAGGALGNLIDRLLRAPGPGRGHVVDFLMLPNWPVFNLADSAIVTAAGLIVVQSLRGVGMDGHREEDGR